MRWMLLRWFCVGLLFGVLACAKKNSAAPETASRPPAEEREEAAASPQEQEPPPPPADAPPGVVLRARIEDPEALVLAALEAAASPVSLEELLQEAPQRVRRLLTKVVDIGASVEALIALNPVADQEPFAAWSLAARGTRPVLSALDKARIEFREGPGGIFYFSFEGSPCALGRSRGPSAARVTCANSEEALRELVAYMLRGLPDESLSDASVHVEVLMAPLRETYGRQLRRLRLLASVFARQMHQGNEKLDRAISDAAVGLAEEFSALVEDVERFELDVWEKDRDFDLSLRLVQKGQTSWTASALRAASRKAAPAPAQFRSLPKSASAASYFRTLPEGQTEEISRVLADLLDGGLQTQGLSSRGSARLAGALTEFLFAERTAVSALGPPASVGDGEDRRLSSAWSVWGTDRSAKEVKSLLADLSAVISSREFQKLLAEDDSRLIFKRRSRPLRGVTEAVVYEWKLPEEAMQLLDWNRLLRRYAGAHVTDDLEQKWLSSNQGYLAVRAAGDMTWMAMGSDAESVAQGLRLVTSPEVEELEADPSVAPLLKVPSVSAGFVRLGGLFASLGRSFPKEMAETLPDMLRDAPHRGRTPVTYSVRVASEEHLETDLVFHVPAEFITDSAAVVTMAFAESSPLSVR